jgi:hypothetical protein
MRLVAVSWVHPMASIKRNSHGKEIKRISEELYQQFVGPYDIF